MRFKFENLKNYALLYIATCAFALLGSPLYCRANFIMQQQLNFTEQEVWKEVKGYEGLYEISTFGRIKSYARSTKGEMVKNIMHHTGYYHVRLCLNGRCKFLLVHRLLAIAFIPNPENKPVVNHINTIKSDCRISNLEWVTQRANIVHSALLKKSSSKYTGVHRCKVTNKWKAIIAIKKKNIHLGSFAVEKEAHYAYEKALAEINKGIFVAPVRSYSSEYKGVVWNKESRNWMASCRYNGKTITIGRYNSEKDAYEARQSKIRELQKEFNNSTIK